MQQPVLRRNYFLPAALGLALLGFWTPWLTNPAAALRLNAYELSEWVTFLPGVRSGELPLSRLAFLLPSACLAGLFGLAAAVAPGGGAGARRPESRRTRSWLRDILPDSFAGWLSLGLAVLSAATVFPYYPYILSAYADTEFQLQFVVACGSLAAVVLGLILPSEVSALVQLGLALAGGLFSFEALWTLWPVASDLLGAAWVIGGGWAAVLLGFAGAAVHGWASLFRPRL